MGTVSTTTDGRRSARLTSTTETGDDDGTVVDGGTTQPRTAANIRAERMVLDRLVRSAQPSLMSLLESDDEAGGAMGTVWTTADGRRSARLASTTETGDDDGTVVDGGTTQGTVEGPLTLEATVGLTDGHDGAAPLTVPGPPKTVWQCAQMSPASEPPDGRL